MSPARSSLGSVGSAAPIPRKNFTGGFLMYIRLALKGQNEQACEQARAVQDAYATMSSSEKNLWLMDFFRAGGKRSGLSSIYQQCMVVKNKCEDLEWEGYLTVGTLMTLWGVCLLGTLKDVKIVERQLLCLKPQCLSEMFFEVWLVMFLK